MYNYTGLNAPQNTSSIWDFMWKRIKKALKKKKKGTLADKDTQKTYIHVHDPQLLPFLMYKWQGLPEVLKNVFYREERDQARMTSHKEEI